MYYQKISYFYAQIFENCKRLVEWSRHLERIRKYPNYLIDWEIHMIYAKFENSCILTPIYVEKFRWNKTSVS